MVFPNKGCILSSAIKNINLSSSFISINDSSKDLEYGFNLKNGNKVQFGNKVPI